MLDHALRGPLAGEAHARPFLRLEGPARLSHLAVYSDEPDGEVHPRLIAELCAAFGIAPPPPSASHFRFQHDGFHLKWERHIEFSTFTFVLEGARGEPFSNTAISRVPEPWLAQLQGKRLVALHAEVLCGDVAARTHGSLRQWFTGPVLVGSRVLTGGEVWCDWHINPDGFSRFLVLDLDFREAQVGRLLQRLSEIETYRMMALLALPIARTMAGTLSKLEAELSAIMERMDANADGSEDPALLQSLTHLAVRVQALSAYSNRFSASRAYDRLLSARIVELREERIEGVPTIGEFMERRQAPAMDTCQTVQARQEQLATLVARAIDLLRTRVNLAQERQTHALLQGMNRTAQTQLHMQHAVEGLSVAAISYYVLSLVGVGLKALKGGGLAIEPEVVEGMLIAPVALGVFFGVRRLRKKFTLAGQHH
ncbi:DUF3422 domain-containing protein [Crenobacter sp. SG2303]|uniref:DUF3422 domain-containing protein n=1 Tax=Crenobacter oryzisoli TaxID=3056844 RepID=A0ABT7XST5_9NEIS|nr:DUF3422 domain-containing protein [Crenobacter sp. SG2303]MDN0076780.1 DUF3422 domain-containing protein [Crenobacter sp. SG2303]